MEGRTVSGAAILESLPPRERELLEGAMVDVTVEAGESLGRTGDFGWAMYLILEGSVDIVSDGELVATLGPGDLFGEVALLRAGRRMADVVARTQLELRALFTRDFIRLRDELTVFEAELRRLIDARLEASS